MIVDVLSRYKGQLIAINLIKPLEFGAVTLQFVGSDFITVHNSRAKTYQHVPERYIISDAVAPGLTRIHVRR